MEDISISIRYGRYSMSNLHEHALTEFKVAGWLDDSGKYTDEMQEMICTHVLKLMDLFADEGHSGSTAPYTINLFKKLAMFKPITPLTGADDEWVRHDYGVEPTYQNKRLSSVFKDANGDCYNIDGKVFWEWYRGEDGNPTKIYYTSGDSRVPVTFPYAPPDEPIYEYRYSEDDSKQTEKGFIDE